MHQVAVIGASGYTGVELLRLLSLHPDTELVCVTSRQYAGQLVSDVFPSLHGIVDLCFEDVDPAALAGRADLVFTAVPHQTAMGMIPALLAAGCRVIDLSADFRITDVEVYLHELFREQISEARLIANPGCYPTSVALALAPLLEKGLIDHKTLIVDSKSGTSGAGRAPKVDTLYCEVNEGFKAYSLPRHRHTPEIEQSLTRLAGESVRISFTPHLLPVNRGILSTCYASLTDMMSLDKLHEVYLAKYAAESFVRVLPKGKFPNIAQVRGSNYCDIGLSIDERTGRVIALAAIDNLVKGAAGQAIQNMNLMLSLPEGRGLLLPPVFP